MIKDNRNFLIFIIGYLSLIIGFFLGEDMAGGSIHDYQLTQQNLIITGFKNGVLDFLINFYPQGKLVHSPVYYIIIYYLQKIFGNEFTRFALMHLFLIIPFIYYKSINLKFKKSNFLIVILIIFFISPSYRSIAIWSGREILTILFLILSIYNYSLFINYIKKKYIYFSFFLLALASYISPEVGIVSLIYFYETSKILNKKNLAKLILFNILISIPFLLYINHYLQFERAFSDNILINFFFNLPFFFSTIFIFTIPFVMVKFNEYLKFIIKNKLSFIILGLIFFFLTINIKNEIGGGAIYYVLKKLNLETSIFIFSIFGVMNIYFIFNKNILYNSFILIILLIQTCLNYHFFQKYVDLTWLLYFIFFFKGQNMSWYLEKLNFKFYLISIYFIIFTGSLIYH